LRQDGLHVTHDEVSEPHVSTGEFLKS
jgi:hypothetical protein